MTMERAYQLIAEGLAEIVQRDVSLKPGDLPFYKLGTVTVASGCLDISCDMRKDGVRWYVLRCRNLNGKFADGTQKFWWSRIGWWRTGTAAIRNMARELLKEEEPERSVSG